MSLAPTAFSPLFRMAVKSGSLPTVLLHIRRGLDVNSVGERGRTPLMAAAAAGRLDVVQLLLEEGAVAEAQDAAGMDAQEIARDAAHHTVADLISRYVGRSHAPTVPAAGPAEVAARRVISAQPSASATPQEPERQDPEDFLGDEGWDAEPPPSPPPAQDQDRLDDAFAVHSAISARVSANTDSDWSEIAVDLPRVVAKSLRASAPKVVPAMRQLLRQAASVGVVTAAQLALAAAAAGLSDPAGGPSSLVEAVLDDLGCEVIDPAHDQWWAEPLCRGEADRHARQQADEAGELLASLAAPELDLVRMQNAQRARWKPLSKADQLGLWKAYRQGRRDLAFALSSAPHILDELVARLDRLSIDSAGETRWLEERAEGKEADEVVVDGEALDASPADLLLDTVDPALARDLGQAVQRARAGENPDVELAEQLLELELPVHLIDQVRRALLLDPASAVACGQLSQALRKIERARTALVESHQRFVIGIARRYQYRGLELMDLVQEGNIGLLKAIEKFDQARGFAFTTYATWWVRQAITRSIADLGATIRIPVHRQESTNKVTLAARAWLNQFGRQPLPDELAKRLDLPLATVALAMCPAFEHCALDEAPEPGGRPFNESLADPRAPATDLAVINSDLRGQLTTLLRSLGPREERIVRMRFGIDLREDQTLEEIGDPMGVTRERIRQIEAKALGKLRHPARSRVLRAQLDR